MDIREDLDQAFGDGPDQRPVSDYLTAGRRALRTRRAMAGAAALAVAGVIGGTAWLVGGGGGEPTRDDAPVATTPSETGPESASPEPGSPEFNPSESAFLGEPAALIRGRVHLAEGWREVARLKNPMHYTAPNRSVALEVRNGDRHKYVLLVQHANGRGAQSDDVTASMAAWLQTATANQHELDVANGVVPPDGTSEPLVTMRADGTLAPRADLEIVEQVGDPGLGPNFAGPADPTAAARLDMPSGPDVYVVVRRIDGGVEVIRGGNANTFPTLDAFLAHARSKYTGDTSEGLR